MAANLPGRDPGGTTGLGEEGLDPGNDFTSEVDEAARAVADAIGTAAPRARQMAQGSEYGQQVVEEHFDDLAEANRDARRAAKAEKRAEMEEAHANGEPYLWEESTDYLGNEYELWIYPDGTEVTTTPPDADGQREVLEVEYPDDVHPVFLGQIPVDGEYVSVFEIPPFNTLIVVDADGNSLGTLEEFDDRIVTVDASQVAQMYGVDVDDLGATDNGNVNLMWEPMGPPTYDTQLVNADTGEVIITDNSGVQFDYATASMAGYPPEDGPYTQYQAPGNNEYYIVVDASGEIVNAYVDQPDEEWSALWGLVTHYEDGTTTVDLGPLEFDVDIEGPEVGGAVRVDIGVAEAELGGRYNLEDGSWEVFASASADVGVASGSLEMAVGQDADGHTFFDLEAEVEFMVGPVGVGVGAGVHFYETDDGYMLDVHAEGSASMLGLYAEAGWHGTVVTDADGAMVTQSTYVGAGIEGVGGLRFTGQSQVTFNDDGEVTGYTSGVGLSAVDRDGDEVGMIGVFGNSERENWADTEWLDTGFRERDTRPALPGVPGQDGVDDAASELDDDPAPTAGPRGPRQGGASDGPGARLRDDFDTPPALGNRGGQGGGVPRPEPSPAGPAGAAVAAGDALVERDDITVLPAGRQRAGAADTADVKVDVTTVEVEAVEVEAVEVVAVVEEADDDVAEEAAVVVVDEIEFDEVLPLDDDDPMPAAFDGRSVDHDRYEGDAGPARPFAGGDDADD